MPTLSRRRFCASSSAALSLLAAGDLRALQTPAPSAYTLVAAVDRDRILRLAAQWLPAQPETITS
ncbi:MAG TPA: hypothetical protein VM865_06350, partial [Acidobacteriaceae bacterium]|nr:hypothetical protein [Acidobacteriaceae bacterium]